MAFRSLGPTLHLIMNPFSLRRATFCQRQQLYTLLGRRILSGRTDVKEQFALGGAYPEEIEEWERVRPGWTAWKFEVHRQIKADFRALERLREREMYDDGEVVRNLLELLDSAMWNKGWYPSSTDGPKVRVEYGSFSRQKHEHQVSRDEFDWLGTERCGHHISLDHSSSTVVHSIPIFYNAIRPDENRLTANEIRTIVRWMISYCYCKRYTRFTDFPVSGHPTRHPRQLRTDLTWPSSQVLAIFCMAPKDVRIIQAHHDGERMVLQYSPLISFFDMDEKEATSLVIRYIGGDAVGY